MQNNVYKNIAIDISYNLINMPTDGVDISNHDLVDKMLVKNEHYAISLFGIPYRGCKLDAPKHISSIRSLSAPLYLPQY